MALLNPQAWAGKIYSKSWITPKGGTIAIHEPATGELLAEVGLANGADVQQATEAAAKAQQDWWERPAWERRDVLHRVAHLLQEHKEEIVTWLVREGGGVRPKAEFEVKMSYDEVLEAAALPTRPIGYVLPITQPGRNGYARRIPRGVVGVISPFNFPLILALRSIAPALALGNTVVLKPDPQTAVSGGVLLARLFEEAGLPAGVFHMVPGDAETGEALVQDRNISMISFTGSTAVGRHVAMLAASSLKKVALELGGNNAFIVLDDADLDAASSAGAYGSFLHQGQICMTAGRHIVSESVAEQYVALLAKRAARLPVGNPYTEQVAIGPIINIRQLDRVQRIVDETVAAGATLVTGGQHQGPFYQPTVLASVKPTMPAFAEEIFGPVAPVTVVKSDEEAIEVANSTEYGLSAAVQSRSESRALAIAERLRSGLVHVNDQTVNYESFIPFGGMGASGNGGRFGGDASLDEFTQWQWITTSPKPTVFPF